ncbi:gliding motility-associated C-terminal domain-containing protein [bacterium SCSIO 12741]|nr:gliding motility-associated C-terminal domain-containing protein [bacterium SCSIO 12741]
MKNWKFTWTLVVLLAWTACHTNLLAQKEANWWYFGMNAGLDFNPGSPPTGYSNGAMTPLEGCASISHPTTGVLQFYSDGISVWNRNHVQMANGFGLQGNASSSHSGVIVPFVGNPNKYYLFTVPAGPSIGAKYSIVDMTLNSGLGDVVITSKNTSLSTIPVADKLSAIGHKNGKDIWVTIQDDGNWSLHSFLITSTGVSTTPVISTVSGVPATTVGHYGCMKYSPNGKLLCTVAGNRDNLMIFNFDNATGVLTNLVNVSNNIDYDLIYGVEFSPNSERLYISTRSKVYQFDVSLPTSAAILASRVTIASISTPVFAQMQLAPDQKIYISRPGQSYLSLINAPDSLGTACNYSAIGFNLPSGASCRYGLPTFIQSFFETTVLSVEDACDSQYVKISVKDTSAPDSVYYDYGDPASGSANYSWNLLDSHQFSTYGKFLVTAFAYYTDKQGKVVVDTLLDTIHVERPPVVYLASDTMVCIWDSLFAKVTQTSDFDLLWSDSSTENYYKIDTTGTLWVTATNRCGSSVDTATIDSLFLRSIDLGPDTTLCVGDTIFLDVSDTLASYLWSDSSTSPYFAIDTGGLVWAQITNVCGIKRDSIKVDRIDVPHVDLGPDTVVCLSSNYILGDIREDYTRYTWHNGWVNIPQIWANSTGLKWLEKETDCGIHRDSAFVVVQKPPKVDLGADTLLCFGDTLTLAVLDSHITIAWQNGSSDSIQKAFEKKTYWVDITNSCGSASDTIEVDVLKSPVVKLPSDTVLCQGDSLMVEMPNPQSTYAWSDGSTKHFLRISKPGIYWGRATNLCGFAQDQFTVSYDDTLRADLGPDTILCDDQMTTIGVVYPNGPNYLWDDGATTPRIQVNAAGTYRVTISNSCGSSTSEKIIYMDYTPEPDLGPDQFICNGEEVILRTGITEADLDQSTVKWQNRYKRTEFGVSEENQWFVEVANHCGVGRDTMRLGVHPLPRVGLPLDTTYCDGQFLIDLTRHNYVLEWEDGSSEDQRVIQEPGDYMLIMEDENGCKNIERMTVKECPGKFYFPNAFSPNDDQLNDRFRVFKTDLSHFHIRIYNRWNELVYESPDIEEGWDGTRGDNQTDCPVGQYVFKIEFREEANEQTQIFTGTVFLVR